MIFAITKRTVPAMYILKKSAKSALKRQIKWMIPESTAKEKDSSANSGTLLLIFE
ncbi:MAG: hypothetical protein IJX08_02145 [Clostridia bacterium]|nr:hypothetical protein [Clostridia bacterium]